MREFSFYLNICLGCECSGRGVYADAYGTVKLEDGQVDQLVALIRDNGGETDIEKLGLEEKYPEIYEALEDASYEAANEAHYRHWIVEGFEWGYYDQPDDLMQTLEKDGLFEYDPESYEDGEELDEEDLEDAKEEAFSDWFYDFFRSLDTDDKVAFVEKYYDNLDYEYDSDLYGYPIEIPDEIVYMAHCED
ncbi:MAG: hypothetical protein IKX03_04885 [Bacteroidales bacterium]|nr:hypothetical protein [Bacteroidales bacterium]